MILYDFGRSDQGIDRARYVWKISNDNIVYDRFKYLRSVVRNNGGSEEYMKNKIKRG